MKTNKVMIQLGYILGASALLTAIGYFFASNWAMLNRFEKFIPIFVLIVGFYGLSVWLSRHVGREFLSKLSLFASCISFGVGVGLIGQTYNSHADSYSLFLVWFVPALLYAILTRWQPYYVLSYILGHLAYGLFFFPKWGSYFEAEGATLLIWLGLAIMNGFLFILFEKGRIHAPFLKWVTFQATICIFIIMSVSHTFENYGIWMNLPLIAVLAAAVMYAHRTQNKVYLLFAGLWISAAITTKYIELIIEYHNELFFIVSLLFVIVFIGANVMFMNYVRAWKPASKGIETGSEVEVDSAAKSDGDFSKWVVRVLTVSLIIIGSLLGCFTLIGLVTVVLGFDDPANILIGYGFVAVIGMLAAKKFNVLARFTILLSGLMLGAGAAIVTEQSSMLLIFLALTLIAFAYLEGLVTRILFFAASIIIVAFVLFDWINSGVTVLSILSGLLFLLFASGQLIRQVEYREPVLYSSFPAFLLALFALTFLTESGWYYFTNVLFFLLVLAAIVISRQLQVQWVYAWSMGFWIAFLVYKYYDLAWKLLHKSISFAIIGLLILGITVWLEKRQKPEEDAASHPLPVYGANRWLIALLILLQVGAMSLQIGKSEYLLSHGKLIKLQLEPLDPRSLIQGDYVRLRYTISLPPMYQNNLEERTGKGKVAVVLAPSGNSEVYEFRREYKPGESLSPEEIRLNGEREGYEGIVYGIENFFIPEGTGREYEQKAKFAEVKVSTNGDAILVRLTEK
ncbi:GDYXXLXY domain-containing protein [Paenibacillus qinlingensis]|uniref:Membrane-anchored protein/putative membrane protein n=1 Tax=Paenibacillus qinlingensis TaxID=1837343 RepID=A0ABU1NPA8_9BACL|nr:GDYXXLXY domain-containing protein [Paenibacillus qinlingensis]MDR6549284.1 putative membrane-anchored protein/putative membrane protein [Paenibacillus qinlingensis]